METGQNLRVKCKHCSKSFKSKDILATHLTMHDTNAPVKCPICTKSLKNFRSRKTHIAIYHKNRVRPVCKICQKTFTTSTVLRLHTARKHSSTARQRFPCPFDGCGSTFLNQQSIEEHIKVEHVENPYRFPCILCGKEFKRKENLHTHIATHTKEKSYQCSSCGKRLAKKDHLKNHEFVHMEKSLRPVFKCNICPQIFFTKTGLNHHIQTFHENQKNHQCTICKRKFGLARHLKVHLEAIHLPIDSPLLSCDTSLF
ncbi:zinc finger protein 675-like isoform X1 [Folsomia candida]|uniref:zinc finger protein 675-like isoform X1 n=1 Tax=Folsomia candida TaxID=158441 RepID=UPI00160546AB|nr:zinc finger protein 675-like isoform X1 [Folsomia candida]XP_035701884.1 zinc finger protein 675-like isoform X1 [Folsomia candida]